MNPKQQGFRAMLAKMGGRSKTVKPRPTSPRERATPALVYDLMLEALRVSDARLNAIAVELIARFGEGPVRRLVLEAADPGNRPGHRACALETIRRIGAVSDTASYLDLTSLTADKNAEVQAAAEDLLVALRDRQNGPAAEPVAAGAAGVAG
jgi:hypothetical protein